MPAKLNNKKVFQIDSNYGAFFTGGKIEWTSDGKEFISQDSCKLNVFSIINGKVVSNIGETKPDDEHNTADVILTFALSSSNLLIVTAHKSGLLKLWNKSDSNLIKTWAGYHNGPISSLAFNPSSNIIASGGTDSSIRIWNHELKTCIATFRDSRGVIDILCFHPNESTKLVVGVGDDYKLNGWNYEKDELLFSLSCHCSKVTSILFPNDSINHLISTGRDKVIILWNYETQKQIKIMPVYEAIECGVIINAGSILPNKYECEENKIYVAVAGENGVVKIWEMLQWLLIFTDNHENSTTLKSSISNILFNKQQKQLTVTTVDHNIIIHDIQNFECLNQIAGYLDEILDLVILGKQDEFLAVATNSNHIKLYKILNMNCKLIKGHTDIVLALDKFNDLLLSSSKDKTVRLWKIDFEKFDVYCIAVASKHSTSVGSISFGKISHTLFASVSQDGCLMVWNIPKIPKQIESITLQCKGTQIAHDKDINCVTISPNDKIIATGSQDKTVKLWEVTNLSLVGVLRGHKRGVWSVRFSPVDQILLTSSADCTLKLWSIVDTSCIKTIEGHDSSVLRTEFLGNGTLILSTAADGIIKVWSVKTSDCCTSLEHDCKIWAVAISSDEKYFYSGGSDSQIIKWIDVTDASELKEFEERQQNILDEQELNNLINNKSTTKALKYALRLERPLLTFKIITNIIQTRSEIILEETISKLNQTHKEILFKHVITWNTNSHHCRTSQITLNILLKEILAKKFKADNLQKSIEDLLPYTERHFKRVTDYLKELKYLEYTMHCMKLTTQLD